MQPRKKTAAALVAAAEAFEEELVKLEEIAVELERAPISSEKALHRAGKLLGDAGTGQEKLGTHLGALVGAIEATRARQQATMDRILGESKRVQKRSDEYTALMTRFAALGARAKEVNAPVAEIVQRKKDGATPGDILEALRQVEELTLGVANDADAVVALAKEGDWPDVAREAESLRQSMHAARNKLSMAKRGVAEKAPS